MEPGQESPAGKRLSRKQFVAGSAAAGVAIGLGASGAAFATPKSTSAAAARDEQAEELVLYNGKVHTMDARTRVVSGVVIRNGRFVEVDKGVPRHGRAIDLKGRTVVPGLIEGHIHVVSLANRPGYHTVIENAPNIAGVQELLADRRPDVPEGQFITAMGGWHPNMFAERRLPTLAELDEAVSDRPVFLYQGGGGPARTNSLGKAFFESVSDALAGPVTVGADGSIATGSPNMANRALYHLRVRQTFEDKKRSAVDAMAYSAKVGLTALLDQVLPPSNGPLVPTQGLPNLDQFRMYDGWLAVHREGRAFIRLQVNFLHNQNDINLPELKERLRNQFQLFGDDLMMTGAIGEWGAPGDGSGPVWIEAQRVIAQARWRNTNRNLSLAALEAEVAGYEAMDAEFGIGDLRWTLHHLNVCTPELLQRIKALNVGVQAGAWRYPTGTPTAAGAPFRMIVDSGVQGGIHQDGVHIAPMNPWFAVYYTATGVNALGQLINDRQQLTREETLRLFTRENAWHLNMEDRIGSIETGKLADLVVLDKDFLTVTDEQLKRIEPVLTVVGGRVVYDAGVVG
jgi:predicted amidohydrolase YtcJ